MNKIKSKEEHLRIIEEAREHADFLLKHCSWSELANVFVEYQKDRRDFVEHDMESKILCSAMLSWNVFLAKSKKGEIK